MATSFVVQPFDQGPFDKRFDDVFAPAISEAGLEAYRVDRDPTVSIPIEDIEAGIRNAEVCLAEITTDNPNNMIRSLPATLKASRIGSQNGCAPF
ncbi:MAG: hypothetical protein QOG23_4509 [Blastocatellia bacterium]|jgi:hypothetical protein|nr:hypothetical protein [Blastocatellia bacterium]